MQEAAQKIVQYLNDAHAAEQALVTVPQSQVAMTPRGSYRESLETRVRTTRDHANRVPRRRLDELGHASNPFLRTARRSSAGSRAYEAMSHGRI